MFTFYNKWDGPTKPLTAPVRIYSECGGGAIQLDCLMVNGSGDVFADNGYECRHLEDLRWFMTDHPHIISPFHDGAELEDRT